MLWALKVLLGFTVPLRTSGRLYLSDRLHEYGVPKLHVPEPCLQEITNKAVDESKAIAEAMGQPVRPILVGNLDRCALTIAVLLHGQHPSDEDYGRKFSTVVQSVLQKYAVPNLKN